MAMWAWRIGGVRPNGAKELNPELRYAQLWVLDRSIITALNGRRKANPFSCAPSERGCFFVGDSQGSSREAGAALGLAPAAFQAARNSLIIVRYLQHLAAEFADGGFAVGAEVGVTREEPDVDFHRGEWLRQVELVPTV